MFFVFWIKVVSPKLKKYLMAQIPSKKGRWWEGIYRRRVQGFEVYLGPLHDLLVHSNSFFIFERAIHFLHVARATLVEIFSSSKDKLEILQYVFKLSKQVTRTLQSKYDIKSLLMKFYIFWSNSHILGISAPKIDLMLSKQKCDRVEEKNHSFSTHQKLLESDQYSSR